MEKTQRNNIMLAFFTLLAVIVIVSIIGFFTLGKGPEIIQGQAEATEYRVSSKVPGRILKFFVSEGDKVKAGDTLAILEAPDVMAKLSQAQAAEQAAQALNEKALRGTRSEQLQAAYEMWQKAKAGLEIAEKSYNRVNRLYEEGVMTAQKRDEAKAHTHTTNQHTHTYNTYHNLNTHNNHILTSHSTTSTYYDFIIHTTQSMP